MRESIRGKLLLSYLLIIAIFMVGGVLTLVQVAKMSNLTKELVVTQWQVEKLLDAIGDEIDSIIQVILDQGRQQFTPGNIEKSVKSIDRSVLKLKNSTLNSSSLQRLITLLSVLKEKISLSTKLHARPVQLREEFDQLLWTLVTRAITANDAVLTQHLLKLEYLLNDYLIKNTELLLVDIETTALEIRRGHGYVRAPSDFSRLLELADSTVLSAKAYNSSITELAQHISHLKTVLRSESQGFVKNVIVPRGELVQMKYRIVLFITVVAFVCTLLVALSLGRLFSRHFTDPLLETVKFVNLLENNDFSRRMNVSHQDEVGQVAMAINAYADKFQAILLQLSNEIDERKKAESEAKANTWKYRQLSQEFETLLEGISDSIILFSSSAEVVWANFSTNRQLKDDSLKLPSRTLDEVLSLYAPTEPETFVAESLASGLPNDGTMRTVNGQTFGVKTFPIVSESGEIDGVIRIASDITERYQMRQAAIETSRLASLGELAAGVAHEINNPNALTLLNMPVVKALFEDALPILEAHVKQQGDPQLADMAWSDVQEEIPYLIDEMLSGGQRIQHIVEDLKNFVRPGVRHAFDEIDINLAVGAAIRLLQNKIRTSTSHFEINLAVDLPLVLGDLQQIEQVVVNFIQNSCLALTDKEQSIMVSTRFDADKNRCLIEVLDEGQGIATKDLAHIQEPFYTTRRNEGGTGLGLSVSSRIAADHDGWIFFKSEIGKGTCATFAIEPCKEV